MKTFKALSLLLSYPTAALQDAIPAIEAVLDPQSGGPRTPDLGGKSGTQDVGKASAEALSAV